MRTFGKDTARLPQSDEWLYFFSSRVGCLNWLPCAGGCELHCLSFFVVTLFPNFFLAGFCLMFSCFHTIHGIFARVLASCHMSWRARSAHPLRPFNDIFKDYQASLRAAVRTLIPASRPQMIQRWPTPHFRDSFHQFANSTFQLDATPFHLLHQSCPLRFHSPHLLLNQSPPFAFQHALLEHY